jgi:flagellar biosynthesis/type III secretory pathway protein FliH
MVLFIDAETKTSIYVNPNNVKYVREARLGTKLEFVDDTYIIVTDDLKTCAEKLSKKTSK